MILNKIKNLNYLIIFLIILISLIGAGGLYSAAEGSYSPWANRHLVRLAIFLFLAIVLSMIKLENIYKYAYIFFILSLLLLFSVEIVGVLGKGASRWLNFFGYSIQPSEIIKVSIVLALARFYHDLKFDQIGNPINLVIPILIIFLPFILIIKQPDLGTALSILLLGVIILFICGVKIWKFFVGIVISLASIPIMWGLIKPYQKNRIISFLDPESDPLGQGYQLIQSKIALGSGGSSGKGFLQGTQSYLEYLPEKQTDFIFTLIGEEFGFLGSIFIIILYLILITQCFLVSIKSNHSFGRFLALGIGSNLFIYVIMNISMVSGLMPVVGIPLPLISYGGTVMLTIIVSMGLVLNIDINYNKKKLSNNA